MRNELFALVMAAMLAIGTGGALAAGPSSGQTSVEQLPDNHTIDVSDPFDTLQSDAVTEHVKTAWSNDAVQNRLDGMENLHFGVIGTPDEVEVQISNGSSAEPDVVAEIGPDGTVTSVFEPTKTAKTAIEGDYDVSNPSPDSEQTSSGSIITVREAGDDVTRLDEEDSSTWEAEITDQSNIDGQLLFNVRTTE